MNAKWIRENKNLIVSIDLEQCTIIIINNIKTSCTYTLQVTNIIHIFYIPIYILYKYISINTIFAISTGCTYYINSKLICTRIIIPSVCAIKSGVVFTFENTRNINVYYCFNGIKYMYIMVQTYWATCMIYIMHIQNWNYYLMGIRYLQTAATLSTQRHTGGFRCVN